jgi:hypothetical protein
VQRREFITLLGSVTAWPLTARAQQPPKMSRIGFLITAPLADPQIQVILEAFRQGLRELGYQEGQNIAEQTHGAARRAFAATDPGNATLLASLDPCGCLAGGYGMHERVNVFPRHGRNFVLAKERFNMAFDASAVGGQSALLLRGFAAR